MSMTYERIIRQERDRVRRGLRIGQKKLVLSAFCFVGLLLIVIVSLTCIYFLILWLMKSWLPVRPLLLVNGFVLVPFFFLMNGLVLFPLVDWQNRLAERRECRYRKDWEFKMRYSDGVVLYHYLYDLLFRACPLFDDQNDQLNALVRKARGMIANPSSYPALHDRSDLTASPMSAPYRVGIRVTLGPSPSILERLEEALDSWQTLREDMGRDREPLLNCIKVSSNALEAFSSEGASPYPERIAHLVETIEAHTIAVQMAASNFEDRRKQIIAQLTEAISMAEAVVPPRPRLSEEAEEEVFATNAETKGSTR